MATIRTTRRTTHIIDANGALVVELADDRVTGTPAGADAYPVVWREVEVELGDAGDEGHLERVVAMLDGARPAVVTRKITHVLGEPPRAEHGGSAALVVDYLRDQCAAVLLGDVGLRDDPTPEVVHATRVGLRRLRSTLRLFDHVVDEVPGSFDADLGWLAGLLSPIRDADILGRRLAGALDELDPRDVVGPVPEEVRRALRAARRNGLEELRQAADAPRYRGVMATLVRWYASVPVRDEARVRPRRTLRKAEAKVRRRLADATDAHGLHQSRKAAKRLRYASDLLEPVRPEARKVARGAKKLQTTLGDHQDYAVGSDFVRSMARSGEVKSAFTYGVLADRFDQHAARIRSAVLDG